MSVIRKNINMKKGSKATASSSSKVSNLAIVVKEKQSHDEDADLCESSLHYLQQVDLTAEYLKKIAPEQVARIEACVAAAQYAAITGSLAVWLQGKSRVLKGFKLM